MIVDFSIHIWVAQFDAMFGYYVLVLNMDGAVTEIFCYSSPVKPNQIDKVDLCSTRCEYKHRPQLTAERINRTEHRTLQGSGLIAR